MALKFSAQQVLAFNGHFLQAKWKTLVQPNQFLPPKAGLKTWLDRRYSQGEIKRLEKSYKNKGLVRPAGEAKRMLVSGSMLTFLF